jgi:Spy/CpxP family protein refolding chaperone
MTRSNPNRSRFTSAYRASIAVAALSVLLPLALPSHAQDAAAGGGRQRGGGGFGGGFGGGGGFGQRGGGMRQQQPLTAVQIPVDVLTKALALSADQTAKITAIQQGLGQQRQAAFESVRSLFPNADQNNAAGGDQTQRQRPDQATIQAAITKARESRQALQTSEEKAAREISENLTPEQRTKMRDLLADAELFRNLSLPYQTLGDVILTSTERTALTTQWQDIRRENQRRAQRAGNGAQNNGGGGQAVPGGAAAAPGGGQDFRAMMMQRMEEMQKEREATYQKALAALTPEHKTIIEAYVKANPRPQFGGFGENFGGSGFGRGGFGGGQGGNGGGFGGGRRGNGGGAPPAAQQ